MTDVRTRVLLVYKCATNSKVNIRDRTRLGLMCLAEKLQFGSRGTSKRDSRISKLNIRVSEMDSSCNLIQINHKVTDIFGIWKTKLSIAEIGNANDKT